MRYSFQYGIVRVPNCFVAGLFLTCVFLYSSPLYGNDTGPPVHVSSQIEPTAPDMVSDDMLLDEKLDCLNRAFTDMYPGAALWMVSWAMISQVLFAYQLIEAIQGTENWITSRPANIVGASQSLASLVWALAVPFRPLTAKQKFHAMNQSSEADKKQKVQQGERLLQQADADVGLVRSWISHVANLGVCLLGGAVIWGVEGRGGWKHAVISTGAGIVFTLANIWSVPTKAVKHYKTYSRRFGNIGTAKHRGAGIGVLAMPSLNSVTVGISF
jgi:hypothetical protein